MASIVSSTQFLLNRSRFSSLNIISPNLVLLKSTSVVSRASQLQFPPLSKNHEFSGKILGLPLLKRHRSVEFPASKATADDTDGGEIEISEGLSKPSKGFAERFPALVTGFFFFMWYFLNVIFNILNKKVYNYIPYPYFVSVIHLLVGIGYCLFRWGLGLPNRAELLAHLTPVAFCHALGHVMSNVSFTTVAVSFTHTIKGNGPLAQQNYGN